MRKFDRVSRVDRSQGASAAGPSVGRPKRRWKPICVVLPRATPWRSILWRLRARRPSSPPWPPRLCPKQPRYRKEGSHEWSLSGDSSWRHAPRFCQV